MQTSVLVKIQFFPQAHFLTTFIVTQNVNIEQWRYFKQRVLPVQT